MLLDIAMVLSEYLIHPSGNLSTPKGYPVIQPPELRQKLPEGPTQHPAIGSRFDNMIGMVLLISGLPFSTKLILILAEDFGNKSLVSMFADHSETPDAITQLLSAIFT